jgi:hypothetical protein
VHESSFSNVYHSPLDSTTYLNFEYATNMVKASLATAYMVSQTAGPRPLIVYEFQPEAPLYIEPYSHTTINFNTISTYGAVPIAGTGMLNYSVDGSSYISIPFEETGLNQFEVVMPGFGCYETVEYYFSMVEASQGIQFYPQPENPIRAVVIESSYSTFEDDFALDLGWTTAILQATSGFWERGIPVNDPSWSYDPTTDADGNGYCYLTGNQLGNTDVDNGKVSLYSPVFPMEEKGFISYSYFLRLTTVGDALSVFMRDAINAAWIEVLKHDTDSGNDWQESKIYTEDLIAKGLTPSSSMQIMFSAADNDPQSIVEAGIDAFKVIAFDCNAIMPDIDGDGVMDLDDNCPEDFNPDQLDSDGNGVGDVCQPCCLGMRGNVDYDPLDVNDIDDLVYLVDFQFNDGTEPECFDEADIDGSQSIDIDDLICLVGFQFLLNCTPSECPQ